MKRFLLNLVAIIAVMAICGNVIAQDPPKATALDVKQVPKGIIKVDGTADEAAWKAVDFVKSMYVACGGKNATLPTEADLSHKFKLLWSVEGFYLYEEVKDDVAKLWVTGDTNYLRDNTEQFFYTPPAGQDLRTADGAYDEWAAQVRTQNCDDGSVMFGGRVNLAWLTDGPALGTGKTAAVYGSLAGGYTMEGFYDWADLHLGVKPEDLNKKVYEMGYDIGVADADEADRDVCTQWNNTTESDMQWNNINWFGKLSLKLDLVVPAVGIESIADGMKVYVNGNNIEFVNARGLASIYSAAGKQVAKANISANKFSFNATNLAKGLYIVKVNGKNFKIMR